MQSPLEAIAEQRSQALSVANAFDQGERDAHAIGRKIHRQRVGIVAIGIGEIASAQNRRGVGVLDRRGVNVSAIPRGRS